MNFNKKLTLWFLFVHVICSPFQDVQANYSISGKTDLVVWEEYIPAASTVLMAGLFVYSFCYMSDDLLSQLKIKNLGHILEYKEYITRKAEQTDRENKQIAYDKQKENDRIILDQNREREFKSLIKIYSPAKNSCSSDIEMQHLANKTQYSVIQIHEKKLQNNVDFMNVFFDKAQQCAPCIIYIEKDKEVEVEKMYHNYFNHHFDNDYAQNFSKRPSIKCIEKFIHQINLLCQTNGNILMLGIAKNKYRDVSVDDICDIGFNFENENPGYYERIEFLELLLKTRKYEQISLPKIARQTIGFTYHELLIFIEEVVRLAQKDRNKVINSSHVDKACKTIIKAHDIYKIDFDDLKRTAIHEMGHAIITAHVNKYFILYNLSITPQYLFYKSMFDEESTLIEFGRCKVLKSYYDNEKFDAHKEHIMICLAGKIAEQVCFGLDNGKILHCDSGFKDFIDNPGGAFHDLKKARQLAYDMMISYDQVDVRMREFYAETLELVLSYKSMIQQGAKLLEQHEFINGSQVYKLLKK